VDAKDVLPTMKIIRKDKKVKNLLKIAVPRENAILNKKMPLKVHFTLVIL